MPRLEQSFSHVRIIPGIGNRYLTRLELERVCGDPKSHDFDSANYMAAITDNELRIMLITYKFEGVSVNGDVTASTSCHLFSQNWDGGGSNLDIGKETYGW